MLLAQRRRVELALGRRIGADAADVRPRLEPVTVEHRRLRRGRRDHEIAFGDGVARLAHRARRHFERALDLAREVLGLGGVEIEDADVVDRPHFEERRHLIARLHARAEDAEHPRVGPRQILRGHRGRRAGAHAGQPIAGDDRAERAGLAAEKEDREVGLARQPPAGISGQRLQTEETELGENRRHHAEGAAVARHVSADPGHDDVAAGRVLRERLFDHPYAVSHREAVGNVRFGEK